MQTQTDVFFNRKLDLGKQILSRLPASPDEMTVLAQGARRRHRRNSIQKPGMCNIVDKSVSSDSRQSHGPRSVDANRKAF